MGDNDGGTPPLDVSLSESLGRGVFFQRIRKQAIRKIIRSENFESKNSTQISVDRLDWATSVEMAKIAITNRPDDKPFYGWAVVSAEVASMNGREVRATPQESNPYHADILLPSNDEKEMEELMQHLTELAGSATWRESPIPV